MLLSLPESPCHQSRSQRSRWGGSTSARPQLITWERRANQTLTRGERHAITCKHMTHCDPVRRQKSHLLLICLSAQVFHAGGGAARSVPQSELHCGCSSVWEDHRQGNVWPCLSASYNNHIRCECGPFLLVYCTCVTVWISSSPLSVCPFCMAVIPSTHIVNIHSLEDFRLVAILLKPCILKHTNFFTALCIFFI